eukprot:363036-Chlamydomonas_euryale.AAC.1
MISHSTCSRPPRHLCTSLPPSHSLSEGQTTDSGSAAASACCASGAGDAGTRLPEYISRSGPRHDTCRGASPSVPARRS